MLIKKLFYLYYILFSKNSIAYSILIYEFLRIIFFPLNLLFYYIENFLNKNKNSNIPIIFVIGSHRSGSTFVAQTLLRKLDVYGLNNLNNIFNRSSIIIPKLIKKLNINYGPVKNFYGQSKNLFDVNDNYQVWDRWFGHDHDFIKKSMIIKRKDLREYFRNIYMTVKKPILTKNGRNIFVINELNMLFKNAFFIIVTRDHKNIVNSTMKANKLLVNDKYAWGLKLNSRVKSVEKQCTEIKNYIQKNVNKLPKEKFLLIKYEKFLNKTNQKKLIKKIKKKINVKSFN